VMGGTVGGGRRQRATGNRGSTPGGTPRADFWGPLGRTAAAEGLALHGAFPHRPGPGAVDQPARLPPPAHRTARVRVDAGLGPWLPESHPARPQGAPPPTGCALGLSSPLRSTQRSRLPNRVPGPRRPSRLRPGRARRPRIRERPSRVRIAVAERLARNAVLPWTRGAVRRYRLRARRAARRRPWDDSCLRRRVAAARSSRRPGAAAAARCGVLAPRIAARRAGGPSPPACARAAPRRAVPMRRGVLMGVSTTALGSSAAPAQRIQSGGCPLPPYAAAAAASAASAAAGLSGLWMRIVRPGKATPSGPTQKGRNAPVAASADSSSLTGP
jgi:hypothetical protein